MAGYCGGMNLLSMLLPHSARANTGKPLGATLAPGGVIATPGDLRRPPALSVSYVHPSTQFQRKKIPMKFSSSVFTALAALAAFAVVPASAQTNKLSTVGIVTGTVTVTERVGTPGNRPGMVGNNVAGLAYVAGNVPGAVDTSISFFTLTSSTLPPNPADSFTSYGTLISPTAVGSYSDVAAALTGTSYSGLTFAIDDLGLPIAGTFYTIHRRPTGDYFANIVPRTGGNSSSADLKPMSWAGGVAGGPSNPGTTGYFGLAYATGAVTGYSANSMFYLRTNGSSQTVFGEMIPALTGGSTDKINLSTAVGSFGVGGYTTLAYSPTAFGGYAANQFYYLRLDSVTGNTVLGRLDPSLVPGVRTISDIANLGGVFNSLNYAFDATGPSGVWGLNQLYATGSRTATAQSISFAAIADRAISAGSFTVTPSASSGLTLALTVVSSSTGTASISGPSAGVFTVTPLSPGIITLQATQSGGAFDSNMLRQSFNATGVAALAITTQPTSQSAVTGTTANFSVVASGTSPVSYQWRKGGFNIVGNVSATTSMLTLTNVQAVDAANYDVVVTNLAGSVASNTVTLTVTTATATPVITNAPLTAAGTVGSPFSFTITATNTPTSYSAAPLPLGLAINTGTGVITGTPTTVGTTNVLLGATNAGGTGNATLVITVAAAGVAPVITSPLTAAGNVATVFSYAITATNSPTSYSASPLPAGLAINTGTGAITGTPTTVGTTNVLLGATNAIGTGNATLVVTVAAAGTAPIITNNPLVAAGTVGTPFSFALTASGTPTSYAASGLPVGLVLNTVTGVITGTPALPGTASVPLGATNAFGTGSATLSITIAAAAVAPIITSPTSIPATAGAPITYVIVATGLPTSYTATGLPAGLALNPLTGAITGTPATPGTYTVVITATNTAGTSTVSLTIIVAPATVAPVITSPTRATGTVGTPLVTYLIAATGLPTSYSASGLPAGLTVNSLTGAINGTPTASGTFTVVLTATNSAGTTTATLTLTIDPTPASRIVNFSARAVSGPGSQTLIVGFVVTGDGKNLMVRGIGPTLATFGVVNALADPMLSLFGANGSVFASNDDWQTNLNGAPNGTLIASVAAQVGAFALPNGSKDSALLATFNNGSHTTSMVRPNSTTGVALTEIYDIDTNSNSRLTNVSARMNVTIGEGTLIAGLVIAGNTPKTVLVRGVGPTLSAFAVAGVLADPQIAVYSGSTLVASNDNWETGTSTAVQISDASAQVGAFALAAGSKDAALLLTLQPGAYTVVVSGVSNTAGVALVEVYDVK